VTQHRGHVVLDDGCEPLPVAGTIGLSGDLGQPIGGVRITSTNGEFGQNGLGEKLRGGGSTR
jgi:hypothetical protein